MRDSDRSEFARVLNGLAAIKPGVKLTAEGLEVYWLAMRDWRIEDFRAAAAQLARTVEFFPNPYHFEQLRKAGRMTSGEAWSLVREAARAGREFADLPANPALLAAVRSLGGLRAIGLTNTDQMQFLERRFAEHYDAISDREDVREALPQIAGPTLHIGKLPYDAKRRLT